MSDRLQNQVAVITGASSGLGRRFAQVLANEGCAVAVMARRTDRLESLVASVEAAGGRAAAIPLDVADAAAIGPALDAAQDRLGPMSIMINNAGVGGDGMALDISIAGFDQTMAVNVRGVYFGAREAAQRMIANGEAEAGRARIVNLASIASDRVLPGLSAYNVSKAAVAMMTKALAREWARRQVAVNALAPGYIETEINDAWFASEGGQKQIKGFPRRRLMDEDSLDEALLLLCGASGRFLTGTVLTVDDGQSL